MKEMRIMRAIGDIDDIYIEEAAPAEKKKAIRFAAWTKYAGMAAAAVLVVGIGILVLNRKTDVGVSDQTGTETSVSVTEGSTDFAQAVSPVEDFDTLEDAVKYCGIGFNVPESVGKFRKRMFSVITGNIIQVIYYDENDIEGLCLRKTQGTEDPSGAYYELETVIPANVGGRNVTMYGVTREDSTHIYKAVWTEGKYVYSATAPYDYDDYMSSQQEGFTQSEMEEIISNIR